MRRPACCCRIILAGLHQWQRPEAGKTEHKEEDADRPAAMHRPENASGSTLSPVRSPDLIPQVAVGAQWLIFIGCDD